MINLDEIQIPIDKCVHFWRTKDEYGELTNMCGGFPLNIYGHKIPTSENLYQSCRFPDYDTVQISIFRINNPFFSKKYAYQYIKYTRSDWTDVNIKIMEWCLRLKFYFYYSKFLPLFEKLRGQYIVERSIKDEFWGCKLNDEVFKGINALGKLIMLIRDSTLDNKQIVIEENKIILEPPNIPNFKIAGKTIETFKIPI